MVSGSIPKTILQQAVSFCLGVPNRRAAQGRRHAKSAARKLNAAQGRRRANPTARKFDYAFRG